MLIIIAGFQNYYWKEVFARVSESQKTFLDGIDVCICNPGQKGAREELSDYAQKYGWSYLELNEDRLARAQNVAIKIHPNAKYIFKIDEDILLSKDYFTRMMAAYQRAEPELSCRLGFMAPLINLNGYCSKIFLETIGEFQDYEKNFGKYYIGLSENVMPIDGPQRNAEVGPYIWSKTVPFDKIAKDVAEKNKGIFSICPIRFSIGAILFSRDFWDEIDGFQCGLDGMIGTEEEQMNAYCMVYQQAIVVAHDILVGHLGFYTQKEGVRKFFEQNYDLIKMNAE